MTENLPFLIVWGREGCIINVSGTAIKKNLLLKPARPPIPFTADYQELVPTRLFLLDPPPYSDH